MATTSSLAAAGTAARSRRAELKRKIQRGEVDLAALLAGTADERDETVALDMRVFDLVRSIDGVGPETTTRLLGVAAIRADQRLAQITLRRRRQLGDAIRKETH